MDAFPLTAPNGTVYAWACGRCRHTGSQPSKFVDLNDEDIARFAEDSRENAARCCACRGCGTYLPLHSRWAEKGDLCEACWPAEKERRDAALKRFEYEEAVRQRLRDASLDKASDSHAATSLLRLIRDISEDTYCAGWMTGIEYELWRDIYDLRVASTVPQTISPHQCDALISLSRRAGGWWYYDDDSRTPLFVTFDEMGERYERYKQRGES